jgi:hypothetical protein
VICDLQLGRDERVAAEDQLVGVVGRRRPGDRQRLAQRVLGRDDARRALVLLGDVGRPDLEVEAQVTEDRAALGRAAGEDKTRHVC